MKTLSLTQPWATLVVIGAKKFETRSWATKYRGPLLIHAAKTFPRYAKVFCSAKLCMNALAPVWNYKPNYILPEDSLLFGAIIGKVNLINCEPTAQLEAWIDDRERAFGDYSPGRFAWKLDNPEQFKELIPAKGALGLWEFNYEQA